MIYLLDILDTRKHKKTKARKIPVKRAPPGKAYNSFLYLLTDPEKERLKAYNQLWKNRHGRLASRDIRAVVHLGDNPHVWACWSINGHFPSLRKSMGLLWHCQSETIITPRELLSIMGWPVYSELSTASCMNDTFEFPDLKRARKYAGNAIHVPTFGMFLLTCLACVQIQ